MVKEIVAWKASDGKVFVNCDEANIYEKEISKVVAIEKLSVLFDKLSEEVGDKKITSNLLSDFVLKNAKEFHSIISLVINDKVKVSMEGHSW